MSFESFASAGFAAHRERLASPLGSQDDMVSFTPDSSVVFETGDRLVLLGPNDALERLGR